MTTVTEQSRQPIVATADALVGGTVVICLLAFGLLFSEASVGAVRVWIISPTFNHCFLVLPLSLFLIWQRRHKIDFAALAPDIMSVLAVLALCCAWIVASIASVLEAEQFVVMTIIQVTLFAIFGASMYRSMAAPLLYLYFLVPSGAFLIPALQAFTAQFTVLGLHLLAIPVFSTGAVIEIPAGTFAVAEACAGLRFLVASVAFGVFFSILMYERLWRRLLFIILAILFPVIANGIRALGLLAAAEWMGSPTAVLADHIIYGWIFFSFVLIVLIVVGRSFSDRLDAPTESLSAARQTRPTAAGYRRMVVVGGICFLVAAVASMASSRLTASEQLVLPSAGPHVDSPWQPDPASQDWKPLVVSPSRFFLQTFVSGRIRIDRFIALYAKEGHSNNLVRSENRDEDEKLWTFNSEHDGQIESQGVVFPVRVSTWFRGSERRLVWSFFVVGGQPVSDAWRAKWDQLRAFFGGEKCISAYVALSVEGIEDGPAANAVADLLTRSEPLSRYLCRTTKEESLLPAETTASNMPRKNQE